MKICCRKSKRRTRNMCPRCYARFMRAQRVKEHRCTRCGKSDQRTQQGYTSCDVCLQHLLSLRRDTQRCRNCVKPLPRGWAFRRCSGCLDINLQGQLKRHRQLRAQGKCRRCTKTMSLQERKHVECSQCMAKSNESARFWTAVRNGTLAFKQLLV